jgi:hypothetical protein
VGVGKDVGVEEAVVRADRLLNRSKTELMKLYTSCSQEKIISRYL